MAGIGSKVAGIAAGKVATKAVTETWRTATLGDPPNKATSPLPRTLAWAALLGAVLSVVETLVTRAMQRK